MNEGEDVVGYRVSERIAISNEGTAFIYRSFGKVRDRFMSTHNADTALAMRVYVRHFQ
jgi:hypothetical protein